MLYKAGIFYELFNFKSIVSTMHRHVLEKSKLSGFFQLPKILNYIGYYVLFTPKYKRSRKSQLYTVTFILLVKLLN